MANTVLLSGRNLSDVDNTKAARSNLGLYSGAQLYTKTETDTALEPIGILGQTGDDVYVDTTRRPFYGYEELHTGADFQRPELYRSSDINGNELPFINYTPGQYIVGGTAGLGYVWNQEYGVVSNGDVVTIEVDVEEKQSLGGIIYLYADGTDRPFSDSLYSNVIPYTTYTVDVVVTDANIFHPKILFGYEGEYVISRFSAKVSETNLDLIRNVRNGLYYREAEPVEVSTITTLAVTDFPQTPEPNTLYFKVV